MWLYPVYPGHVYIMVYLHRLYQIQQLPEMEAQQEISKQILEGKIGKTYKILVEDISFDKKYLIGRTMQDVPEEDGLVYIKKDKNFFLSLFFFTLCNFYLGNKRKLY